MTNKKAFPNFEDPSTWGEGPWTSEPNREDWVHEGFACFINRNHHGVWCGYVGVPNGHPAYGKGYDYVEVDVHGGLTYANKCQEDGPICHVPEAGMPDDVWWLGFDCGHFLDISPGMEALTRHMEREDPDWPKRPSFEENGSHWVSKYRDINYAKAETNSLAEQLAKLS